MGLFTGQFSDVVEWDEYKEDQLFWKWPHEEIKKGSKLIVRPGQDAVFLYNGKVEGIFRDEGRFDIESDIIPFLTTLASFKYAFHTSLRAEVVFVNTKEITCKWGTANEIYIPAPNLPGGLPIRAFGTFNCRVGDQEVLMEKIAGVQSSFTVEDVRTRIISQTDQLLMKWITKEGRDMFNLQANAGEIAKGIGDDLDMELSKAGIRISGFTIANVSYPQEVQDMVKKAASQSMVTDMGKYQQMAMADALANGNGGNTAADMAGLSVGLMMGQQLAGQMQQTMAGGNTGVGTNTSAAYAAGNAQTGSAAIPNFCPDCGAKTNGANFCANCGRKLI